ncbi:MAG: hypothetical protein Q9159_004006, partial [Coniocarpon cinnabarinum]
AGGFTDGEAVCIRAEEHNGMGVFCGVGGLCRVMAWSVVGIRRRIVGGRRWIVGKDRHEAGAADRCFNFKSGKMLRKPITDRS